MMKFAAAFAAGVAMSLAFAGVASAKDKTIAVSWKTFQEERWKTDEAAIKAAVEAAGNKYISTDAQGSAQKQAADIEGLISQKPDVVLVVAFDSDAILPSIKALSDAGIKSIAYDVQFEDPNALYITFDNVGVGRIIAKEVSAVKPEGDFAIIKGDKGDPNATFLYNGMIEVLQPKPRCRQDQDRMRNLHRRLEAGQCPEEHGAVPDLHRQQGRCCAF